MSATLTDIEIAYGLRGRTMLACEIFGNSTTFARAVRTLGGFACHYDRKAERWRLFNEVATQQRIIREAALWRVREVG